MAQLTSAVAGLFGKGPKWQDLLMWTESERNLEKPDLKGKVIIDAPGLTGGL